MTVKEIIDYLNGILHDRGFHVEYVSERYIPESMVQSETPHHLMSQTFDWRYPGLDVEDCRPSKDVYDVRLTVDDIRYIGNALEVFHAFLFGRYLKPGLENVISEMGEKLREEAEEDAAESEDQE